MLSGNLSETFGLLREAKALWESLEGSDRERLDSIVRRAAGAFLPDELARVREYLLNGKDPLPARLAGAWLHPETRQVRASGGLAATLFGQSPKPGSDDELMVSETPTLSNDAVLAMLGS